MTPQIPRPTPVLPLLRQARPHCGKNLRWRFALTGGACECARENSGIGSSPLGRVRAFLRHRIFVRRAVGDSCGAAVSLRATRLANARARLQAPLTETQARAERDALRGQHAVDIVRLERRLAARNGTARSPRPRSAVRQLAWSRSTTSSNRKAKTSPIRSSKSNSFRRRRRPRDRKRGARNRLVRRSPAARPRRRGIRSRQSADRRIGDRIRAAPAHHCYAHHPGLRTGARARRLARQVRRHCDRIGRPHRRAS